MSLVISKCRYCDRFSTAEHLAENNWWCGECGGPPKVATTDKPTPGPWKIDLDQRVQFLDTDNRVEVVFEIVGDDGAGTPCYATNQKDAALIAEAGTVYHETGFSPRDLHKRLLGARLARDHAIKQRNELLGAVKEYIAARADSRGNATDSIRTMDAKAALFAAIAKAEK